MTLENFQERLHYHFRDKSLLLLAVTHSSWANEHGTGNAHNERLEFLGDAVLEIVVSAQLFARFPEAREGELTRLRSSLVNESALACLARELHLDKELRLARGEENQGGRNRDALLADAMEAVFGGVFLDGGMDRAREVIENLYEHRWPQDTSGTRRKDYKTKLQRPSRLCSGRNTRTGTCQDFFGSCPAPGWSPLPGQCTRSQTGRAGSCPYGTS